MKYNFDSLGPALFEMLCIAIAKSVLGESVESSQITGRWSWDAEFDGAVDYPDPGTGQRWVGHGAVMVKFTAGSGSQTQKFNRFRNGLNRELDKSLSPEISERQREIEYLIIVTNLSLSKSTRSWHEIDRIVSDYAERTSLRDWVVWDGDQLSHYLNILPNVQRTYVLGQDYIARTTLAVPRHDTQRFSFSTLGECPPDCPEVQAAWWRLLATREAAARLFDIRSTLRSPSTAREGNTVLDGDNQDLLRAAIVFVASGVDSCLESLLSHAVPVLVEGNDGARMKFERYVENEVNAQKVSSTFIAALKSPDPRRQLLQFHILALVRSSFQGSGEIKGRALSALGVRNIQISSDRLNSLDAFFTARNDVAHRLDLVEPFVKDGRPIGRSRTEDEVGQMCDEVLLLLRDIILATATNIKELRTP